MDHFEKLKDQVQTKLIVSMLVVSFSAVGTYVLLTNLLELQTAISIIITLILAILASAVISSGVVSASLLPLQLVWQAVLHIDPDHHQTPAPNIDQLKIGRELVTSLTSQIYQFASQENSKDLLAHRREIIQAASIVDRLPLPLFVFNKELIVTNASRAAIEYCQSTSAELFGKPLFDHLNLEFPSENTLNTWVAACQDNKVTDTAYWERVRVLSKEDGSLIRQCDIAAHYNRDSQSGTEFIVTMFDRTEAYTADDSSLSFVAMAVHELRTPITMMRGYIEVFKDELDGKLDEELQSFMLKMETSAKHLSSFVSTLLDVARIDQNQLSLHLSEATWSEVIKSSLADAEQTAKVNDMTIEYDIAAKLPKVAVDRVSIYEVFTNLVENAIKYSGTSKRIIIKSYVNKEGFVETTVQDFGTGIPASVIPNLFEKFSRNHRTRTEVSGTGLGLYLSKAIISAHGGQVWVSSKEGEGSTFGFTLQPYSQLADDFKDSGNKEITRNAHGWIKNHSLYRR